MPWLIILLANTEPAPWIVLLVVKVTEPPNWLLALLDRPIVPPPVNVVSPVRLRLVGVPVEEIDTLPVLLSVPLKLTVLPFSITKFPALAVAPWVTPSSVTAGPFGTTIDPDPAVLNVPP